MPRSRASGQGRRHRRALGCHPGRLTLLAPLGARRDRVRRLGRELAMTTWQSPRLVVGEFGLPWPAVLVSPWQLTARVHRPHSLPLSDLNQPEDWDRLLPSRTVTMSLDAVNGLVLE